MSRLTLVTDLKAIADNARVIRSRIKPNVKLLCVVKADAYGHGAVQTARALEEAGLADAFAVANPFEGELLRKGGIAERMIVVLGSPVTAEDAEISVRSGLSQAVEKPEDVLRMGSAANALRMPAKLHFKIDTGMSRIGIRDENALSEMLKMLSREALLRMEGIFTHFCAADSDEAFTAAQFERFQKACAAVEQAGWHPIRHAAASSALLNERYQLDMVRAGIVLYGGGPDELKGSLKYAQRLETQPMAFRVIEKGDTVGYGRRFTAQRTTRVMTVQCGYGDGYPRILSGRADVIVEGKRAPIIGNICMDMLMADVTEIPEANLQSKVVLLGDGITPEELAEKAETIPYEIMLGFTGRVNRKWE